MTIRITEVTSTNPGSLPKLCEMVPVEFLSYYHSPAFKHLDVQVIAEHHPDSMRGTHPVCDNKRWPGKHKNVVVWWSLANGLAAGWNENPSTGWSFVLVREHAFT